MGGNGVCSSVGFLWPLPLLWVSFRDSEGGNQSNLDHENENVGQNHECFYRVGWVVHCPCLTYFWKSKWVVGKLTRWYRTGGTEPVGIEREQCSESSQTGRQSIWQRGACREKVSNTSLHHRHHRQHRHYQNMITICIQNSFEVAVRGYTKSTLLRQFLALNLTLLNAFASHEESLDFSRSRQSCKTHS